MRRRTAGLLFVGLVALLLPPQVGDAASDRLPDLGMGPITDIRLNKPSDGRHLLRFSATVVNVGAGPFQLQGTSSGGGWVVAQIISDTAGGQRSVATGASLTFANDGHNHYHVSGLMSAELVRLDNGVKVGTSAKSGFCFWDNTAYRLSLPGAPGSPQFASGGCGTPSSTVVTMGLSVGWGDTYPYTLPDQYIDITNLVAGRYRLNVRADAAGLFVEGNESNNGTWVELQIKPNGNPRVVAQGPSA